ncbi:MAG: hypothetical protein WCL30_02700 [Pseudomonadota bacterium]
MKKLLLICLLLAGCATSNEKVADLNGQTTLSPTAHNSALIVHYGHKAKEWLLVCNNSKPCNPIGMAAQRVRFIALISEVRNNPKVNYLSEPLNKAYDQKDPTVLISLIDSIVNTVAADAKGVTVTE